MSRLLPKQFQVLAKSSSDLHVLRIQYTSVPVPATTREMQSDQRQSEPRPDRSTDLPIWQHSSRRSSSSLIPRGWSDHGWQRQNSSTWKNLEVNPSRPPHAITMLFLLLFPFIHGACKVRASASSEKARTLRGGWSLGRIVGRSGDIGMFFFPSFSGSIVEFRL